MTGKRPSDALREHLAEVRAIIARYPVRNPRIFGSSARGEDRNDSDIDILVDPLKGTTFFDLAGLQFELEELLGVHVDVVTPGGLAPDIAARVAQDLKPL